MRIASNRLNGLRFPAIDLPDGLTFQIPVKLPSPKIFRFYRNPIHLYVFPRPAFLSEGRLAIVTDVGGGMRWTRWCRRTSGVDAYGEDAWS